MSDLKSIVTAGRALRARDEDSPLLLATVVQVSGSSYRGIGARMLIAEDRWVTGSVSGGCLEGDVVRRAWWCTRDGQPALLSYDSSADPDEVGWGVGLGCNGIVDLLLEPCDVDDPFDPFAFLEACYASERPAALATVFRSQEPRVPVGARLQIGPDGAARSSLAVPAIAAAIEARARVALRERQSQVFRDGAIEALIEAILPPPHLYIFGAGPDAVPLASMAATLGWMVSVCDPQARIRSRTRFPEADHLHLGAPAAVAAPIGRDGRDGYAVVMVHDFTRDAAILDALLRSRARYIGLLGPRQRSEKLLAAIGARSDPRLHAPVGLDLAGETAPEIALAIVAEIQALERGATARPLRDKRGRIHDRAAAETVGTMTAAATS